MTWRYIPRGAAKGWQTETNEGWQDRPTVTVFEDDGEPQPTGLLDAAGAPLFRVRERAPIGFDLTPRKPRIRVKAGRA